MSRVKHTCKLPAMQFFKVEKEDCQAAWLLVLLALTLLTSFQAL